MKKKLLTLFLLCAMLLSSTLVAFAGDAVTGSNALTKAKSGEAYIIDVRSDKVRKAGNLDHLNLSNIIHLPLFDENNKLDTVEALALANDFNTYVTDADNKAALEQKPIYILCNRGRSGAAKATELLLAAGYAESNVHTITNGAAGLEIRYAFLKDIGTEVDGSNAVAAIGNDDIVILDVRNDARYAAGHLAGSIHIAVFDEGNNPVETADDALAATFIETAKATTELQDKEIYILCNGGQRGARAATVLLKDAGYDTTKIHTITGGASDADVQNAFVKTVTEYNFVSGSSALTAVKNDAAYLIDVRSERFHKANGNLDYLENVIYLPLFDENNKLDTEVALELEAAFNAYVEANKATLESKPIYILCNSGSRGAQKATQLLENAGYNTDITTVTDATDKTVYTITNGAKGLEIRYAFLGSNPTTPVDGTTAVAAIGNDGVVILDVRASGNYASGHLKGSVSLPVFTSSGVVQTADDDLAKAFTEYVTANKADLEGKEIYILCNSGQSGARAATVLLNAAGIDLANIHTITGGAKGTTEDQSVPNALTYVSDTRAINAIGEEGYLILDVRSTAKYTAGHLKGSLSLPVFDADNNLTDELAADFLAYVKAHKADFDGKIIYILCNSGSRGAEKATALLKEAGVDAKIYTIEGGAKSEIIQKHFVTDSTSSSGTSASTTTVKTGDSSNIMLYALMMRISLLAFFSVRKKECTN